MLKLKKVHLACMASFIVHAPSSNAATILVDSGCSLLEAIQTAQSDLTFGSCEAASAATPNTIELPPNQSFDYLDGFENGTIDSPNKFTATPFITGNISIQGNGSTVSRIETLSEFRLFAVTSGSLTLQDLTVSNGKLESTGFGAGIYVSASGALELNNVTVSDNTGITRVGGGVFSLGGPVTIADSTITSNTAESGGGVHVVDASLTISNSQISSNTSNFGGGVFAYDSNVVINQRSRIVGNRSEGNGGGIVALIASTVNISQSYLTSNTAVGNGGAIFSNTNSVTAMTTVTINDVDIQNNSSRSMGGGIYAGGATDLVVSNSNISNQFAYVNGGAIAARGTTDVNLVDTTLSTNRGVEAGGAIIFNGPNVTGTISRSTMDHNHGNSGGAIRLEAGATVEILNSTISNNTALQTGGALFAKDAGTELTLYNSTLVNNSLTAVSSLGAGAFVYDNGSIVLLNSIIAGNSATSTTGSALELLCIGDDRIRASQNTIIGDINKTNAQAFNSCVTTGLGTVTTTLNGTNPTPLNQIIGSLMNNGGPTKTHGLVEGSPALDGGLQSFCTSKGIVIDQRGEPRNDGVCDIGAVEGIPEIILETCFTIPMPAGGAAVFCL